jgi:protein TonB
MKVGEVSDVIRTKQGYIILEVTNRGNKLCSELELLNAQIKNEIQPYLDQIKEKVRAHWYEIVPLQARYGTKQGNVTVRFSILRDGHIADERVIAGSGDVKLDTAGLRAVRQASPFPPFPNTIKMDHLEMAFHFQYNPR